MIMECGMVRLEMSQGFLKTKKKSKNPWLAKPRGQPLLDLWKMQRYYHAQILLMIAEDIDIRE